MMHFWHPMRTRQESDSLKSTECWGAGSVWAPSRGLVCGPACFLRARARRVAVPFAKLAGNWEALRAVLDGLLCTTRAQVVFQTLWVEELGSATYSRGAACQSQHVRVASSGHCAQRGRCNARW